MANENTRSRYVTLDGLRGIAAVTVVVFHAHEFAPVWRPRFGYLAVDLFFLLSGFVLSIHYAPRFQAGMSAWQFLLVRAVRLWPLYLVGLVLGLVAARLVGNLPPLHQSDIVSAFGLNLLMLPSSSMPRTTLLFPLNIPFWSLFYEFWAANLAFALLARRLRNGTLLAIILANAAVLLVFQRLRHTMDLGPTWTSNGFSAGLARVWFSFFAGIAVARLHAARPSRLRLPSWVFIIAFPLLLSAPLGGGRLAHGYEILCALLVFPPFIYLAAAASERRPWFGRTLGDASYAVYTLHYPLLALSAWYLPRIGARLGLAWEIACPAVIFGLSWLLARPDERLRAAITDSLGSVLPPRRRSASQVTA